MKHFAGKTKDDRLLLTLFGIRVCWFNEPYHKTNRHIEVWRVKPDHFHKHGWVGLYLWGWNLTIGDF